MGREIPVFPHLTPEDVRPRVAENRMLLVDVREQNEVALERYPAAVVVPLSSFDPAAIRNPQGRQVVFACRSGRRSVTASLAAQERAIRTTPPGRGSWPGRRPDWIPRPAELRRSIENLRSLKRSHASHHRPRGAALAVL